MIHTAHPCYVLWPARSRPREWAYVWAGMTSAISHNCLAFQEKSHLVQPPAIILEVLGVFAVDGSQLPPRGPLREERVDEEAAEHI